ncbi:MAG TPA: flavodoxin family protein [Methanomassiliicoccales archaeon]|nr:flavodoxin family protein [Methanomassiliicoccales archaeon]
MTPIETLPLRTVLVLVSYHHKNTEKVARTMADVLDAPIMSPKEIRSDVISDYDLIGFGSGIYDGMHHKALLDLADRLPGTEGKKVFLFSTSAIVNDDKVAKDHTALRNRLQQKGYQIVDEFACKGLDTNSFLKYFGGLNKGRPNKEDLELAEKFANNLMKRELGKT